MHVIPAEKDQKIVAIKEDVGCRLQAKLFMHTDPRMVITEMNEWLDENAVNVEHVCQSQSEKGGKFVFIISLFYRLN